MARLPAQIQLIMNDQKSSDLISQYYATKFGNALPTHKQRAACRLEAELVAQGENLYRIEYVCELSDCFIELCPGVASPD